MKIALLGYGKEGQAAQKYFQDKYNDAIFDIFENETPAQLEQRDYSSYDIILRSPSVPPIHLPNETSLTKYFFDHCPCPIIGVTATKGKGTTCSFIKSLLDAEFAASASQTNASPEDTSAPLNRPRAYLVGNIGTPAIEVLDQLTPQDIVVYELSSFQLWDLKTSPHIAIIGQIEPDHLNVHKDYDDYLAAKSNICRYQTSQDFCIYYQNNSDSVKVADAAKRSLKIPYPFAIPDDIKSAVKLPGEHNEENAIAAIAAVAASKNISPDEYLTTSAETIKQGLSSFKGLPHRLEFVRELNNVKYYDDNFATNVSSTKVAINSFPDEDIILILGGRDKTNNEDLPEIYELTQAKNIKKVILLGESGHALAEKYLTAENPDRSKFTLVDSLKPAIQTAQKTAETLAADSPTQKTIVLMSPAAASFDMFKNVYDRGDQYQNLIKNLI